MAANKNITAFSAGTKKESYTLNVRNLSNDKIESLEIQLAEIKKFIPDGIFYLIITNKKKFKIAIPDVVITGSEDYWVNEYEKFGIQYLVEDEITLISLYRIQDYAKDNGKLDNIWLNGEE